MLKEIVSIVVATGAVLGGTTITVLSSANTIEEPPALSVYFENAQNEVANATTVTKEMAIPVATSSNSTETKATELLTTTTFVTTKATTTATMTTATTTSITTTITTEELTEATTEETVTTEETSLYEYNVNSNDVFLIAYAMSREAAYGDYTDATYVGNVIINRVNDQDFPNSVFGVLSQDGQYPWGVSYYSEEYIYDPYFYKIAENLLAGNRPLPESVVYQAVFPQGSGIYCTVGSHYYCYK